MRLSNHISVRNPAGSFVIEHKVDQMSFLALAPIVANERPDDGFTPGTRSQSEASVSMR